MSVDFGKQPAPIRTCESVRTKQVRLRDRQLTGQNRTETEVYRRGETVGLLQYRERQQWKLHLYRDGSFTGIACWTFRSPDKDHIAGLGVLLRKAHVPVYATQATIRQILRYAPLGKVDEELFCPIDADQPFMVGDMKAEAFHISHDAADPVSYRIEAEGSSCAVATDMGCFNRYTVNHLRNLDTILIEANHDERMLQAGPYPWPLKRRILGEKGHLSNTSSAMLLAQVLHDDMKAVFLGHLSKMNNYPDLAYATVISEMAMDPGCHYKEGDIPIYVASREHPMEKLVL